MRASGAVACLMFVQQTSASTPSSSRTGRRSTCGRSRGRIRRWWGS